MNATSSPATTNKETQPVTQSANPTATTKVARVYLRVSTQEQDLTRQRALIEQTRQQGYYIAGVYEEEASGANLKRPELQRLVNDIQPGDVIVAERMDRISRAPLPEAEALIATLQKKRAKLVVPGYVDLSEIQAEGMRVVLDTMQQMLLRMALQAAREDYELRRERQAQGIELAKQQGKYKGKQPDTALHNRVRVLLNRGMSIRQTAQEGSIMPILPFASMQTSTRSRTARLPNTTTNQLWPESTYPTTSEPCIARISPFTWNESQRAISDAPQLSLARLLHSLEPNASIQTTRLLNDCAGLLGALWDDKIWITEAASEALNKLLAANQHSDFIDSIQASYYLSVDLSHVMQPVNTPHLQLVTRNKQQNQLNQLLTDKNSPLNAQKVQLWDVQGKGRALQWVVGIEA